MKALNVLIFLILTNVLFGQSTSRKTVILYNVVPLSVELLNDGTIKSIFGRADYYFKGYQVVQRDEIKDNSAYSSLSGEVSISTNIERIQFEPNMAILNEGTITSLDKIKESLVLNPDRSVIITPYTLSNNSSKSETLLKNRLASCLSYLEIIGVPKKQIILDNNNHNQEPEIILIAQLEAYNSASKQE